MLRLIFKHEWRSLSADKTLWIVAALLLAVVGYGVWNGASWAHFQTRTINTAVTDEQKIFDARRADIAEIEAGRKEVSPFTDPRNPAATGGSSGGGRYAFMPPAPLAALSVGQSDLNPYYFKVSLQSRQAFIGNDEIENPHNLLAGKFDLSFVVVYLLPLVILALSFNLLSGEKEAGTLALIMSQPVSLRLLLIGKIATRFALVLSVIVLSAVAVGVLLGGVNFGAEGAWVRFLLWIVAVAFYSAFWFALAVLVNAWGKGSATNAVRSVAIIRADYARADQRGGKLVLPGAVPRRNGAGEQAGNR